MLCGECNFEICNFEVIFLTPEHISDEYIDSLNDKTHLIHSRNVSNTYTRASQVTYIRSFDFVTEFILGTMCSKSKKVISTATLILNQKNQSINLGILIFKNFANRGYGHLILAKFSDFCFGIFPGFSQEVGTRLENYAMRKIALKAGFVFSREEQEKGLIYFVRNTEMQENLEFMRKPPLLIIANDAGGSAHLAALMEAYKFSPPAILTGPAIEIFNHYGIQSNKSNFSGDLNFNSYVLLGTSLFGGPESQALSIPALSKTSKIALLDHWVNYRERFHPSGKILPDTFLVTNQLAHMRAKEQFPNSDIREIPDFQLAYMRRSFMKRGKDARYALILLEPTAQTSFNKQFPQIDVNQLVKDVRGIARDRNIERIILRPHPAHTQSFIKELSELFLLSEEVTVSENFDLLDDLIKADFVVGFHTYALFLAAELDIQTFGYYADKYEHWTNSFPKISPITT